MIKIELISIGDELLKGAVVNTNAAFLCRHLLQNGYSVARQTTVSDHPEELKRVIEEALSRSDLAICTGGLGTTLDDRSRQVAETLFKTGARVLPNRSGQAPGLIFEKKLILLPGVPKEMEPMFIEQAIPFIEKEWPLKEKRATQQLYFCHVYESTLDPHLRELSKQFSQVEAGVYPAHGLVSVNLSSADTAQLHAFEKELDSRFGDYRYFAKSGKIEEALHTWFVQHKKKLAFAESCTGGMLSSLVTQLSGTSDYFLGSIVAYSNSMKEQLLGVSSGTIQKNSELSVETAAEMLGGVFEKTHADYAIAVTGIAGPSGGTDQKPVGTVWAAIGERGKKPDIGTFCKKGNRQMVILSTANYLLGALWMKVAKGIPAFNFLAQK